MTGFTAEFVGTMILILLGDGVVAGVLLRQSKAENAGWISITAGWAFAVMCGAFTSIALGGPGALNPAGVVAGMSTGAMPVNEGLRLIAGQFLGAFTGAVLVWAHYLPHWAGTSDAGLKRAVFCTAPAIRLPAANLTSEIIGTFVLILVASSIGKLVSAEGMQPFLVGSLVWSIGLSLGGTTGYAINPARDLGPRIAHAILPIPGKGDSDWEYSWIPVVGPVIGGILGAMVFKYLT